MRKTVTESIRNLQTRQEQKTTMNHTPDMLHYRRRVQGSLNAPRWHEDMMGCVH